MTLQAETREIIKKGRKYKGGIAAAEVHRKSTEAEYQHEQFMSGMRKQYRLQKAGNALADFDIRTSRYGLYKDIGEGVWPILILFFSALIIWGPGVLAGFYIFQKIGWYFWIGLIALIYLWWRN